MPPKFKNLIIVCIITILLYGSFYFRHPWTVSDKKSPVDSVDKNVLSLPSQKVADNGNSIFSILKKQSQPQPQELDQKVNEESQETTAGPKSLEPKTTTKTTTENGILNNPPKSFEFAREALQLFIHKEVQQQVKAILGDAANGLHANNAEKLKSKTVNTSNSFQSENGNGQNDNHSNLPNLDINKSNDSNDSAKSDRESEYIFNANQSADFHLEQNDPRLLKYIRDHHLWPPMPVPYNLEKPFEDPTWREGQNQAVLKILKNKRNGIFIEAGANNGEFLSNTLALERDYGWTGILVEPDRKAFKELQGKNRKAWLSNVCLSVSSRPEKVTFLQYKLTSTWSKIANVSEHSKKWDKEQMEEVEVECIPFFSLVLALNMTTIDYFSLDIEGAELQILKTIPFDKVLIRTLSIEYDHIRLVPGADKELKNLMKSRDFTLVTEVTQGFAKDYIYAHDSVLMDPENEAVETQAPVPVPAPELQMESKVPAPELLQMEPKVPAPELQMKPKLMEVYPNFENYSFPTIQLHRIN